MKRLSIVIPIYNQYNYLSECIDSVIEQDLDDYEIILVNDGSTDGTDTICLSYTEQYEKITYIYQQNQGLGAARNKGLKAATGQYIMFVDSDDAIRVNCLGTLMDYIEQRNMDMLYVDEMICTSVMGVQNIGATFPKMQTEISRVEALEYCMQPSHICSRIYKKSLFDGISFETMWYEDMRCFPQLVCCAEHIGYYKMPIYYYRQHEMAITHNMADSRNLDVIKAWEQTLTIKGLTEDEKIAIEKCVLKSIATFCFFKPLFCRDYLKWYNNYMSDKIHGENETTESMFVLNDYPLKQQADMMGDKEVIFHLEKLELAYNCGGRVFFIDVNKEGVFNSYPDENEIVYQVSDCPRLVALNIKAKSKVLYEILNEVQKQNLISFKGEKKKNLLNEIVLEHFLMSGYSIKVI